MAVRTADEPVRMGKPTQTGTGRMIVYSMLGVIIVLLGLVVFLLLTRDASQSQPAVVPLSDGRGSPTGEPDMPSQSTEAPENPGPPEARC